MKGAPRLLPVLLAAGLAAHPAAAAGRPEGISLGRGLFFPAIETSFTADDNLFQQAVNPVAADYLAVGPNLAYRQVLSRSRLDLSWQPRYRWYRDDVIPSRSTQMFDGEWQIETRGGSIWTVKESFENGILEFLESQDFVGGETVFAGQDFTRNQFEGGYGRRLGPRQDMELVLFDGFVKFDETEGNRFYDFSDRGGTASWSWRISEDMVYRVQGRLSSNKQGRSEIETFDLVTGERLLIDDPAGEDYGLTSIRSGFDGTLRARLQVRAFYGYAEMAFKDSAQSDYEGQILDADFRMALTPTLGIRVRAARQPFPSNFNAANYFINENAGIWVEWRTPRRLTLIVGAVRQKNSYKDPIITDYDGNPATGRYPFGNEALPDPEGGFVAGVLRTDRFDRLEARLEFAFIPGRLQAFMRVYDESRTSNLSFAQFDRAAVTLGVRFGWFAP